MIRRMWKNKIKSIMKSGYSQSAIAKAVGLSQPAISQMANGSYVKGPRGDVALKIEALYKKVAKKSK